MGGRTSKGGQQRGDEWSKEVRRQMEEVLVGCGQGVGGANRIKDGEKFWEEENAESKRSQGVHAVRRENRGEDEMREEKWK